MQDPTLSHKPNEYKAAKRSAETIQIFQIVISILALINKMNDKYSSSYSFFNCTENVILKVR